jgi:protein-S-isoprenylcysteine O-methyltransferase Ste14
MTTGIYSVVRNCNYPGLLVNAQGWGLETFRSGIVVLLAILNAQPLLAISTHTVGGDMPKSQFGGEYEATEPAHPA